VDNVFRLLKKPIFRDNETIPLSCLFSKTLFLIALASGARVGELAALRRDDDHMEIIVDGSFMKFIPHEEFRFKSHTRLVKIKPFKIKALPSNEAGLCPVQACLTFIDRTSSLPNPEFALWIKEGSPKPVKNRSLALNFQRLIRLSHIGEDIKGNIHQVRGVAASLAFKAGISLKSLRSRAQWGSESVFFKNYWTPVSTTAHCIALGKVVNKKNPLTSRKS
jgi:integrase